MRAPTPTQSDRGLGARTPLVDFLAKDPAIRSNTSVCLKIVDPAIAALPPRRGGLAKSLAPLRKGRRRLRHRRLSRRAAGPADLVRRDCRDADLDALTPWLDYAFALEKAKLAKAA